MLLCQAFLPFSPSSLPPLPPPPPKSLILRLRLSPVSLYVSTLAFRFSRPRISTKRRNTAVLQSNDLQNSTRSCSEAGKGQREKHPSLTFAKSVRTLPRLASLVARHAIFPPNEPTVGSKDCVTSQKTVCEGGYTNANLLMLTF